jgi:hypothetical protein
MNSTIETNTTMNETAPINEKIDGISSLRINTIKSQNNYLFLRKI